MKSAASKWGIKGNDYRAQGAFDGPQQQIFRLIFTPRCLRQQITLILYSSLYIWWLLLGFWRKRKIHFVFTMQSNLNRLSFFFLTCVWQWQVQWYNGTTMIVGIILIMILKNIFKSWWHLHGNNDYNIFSRNVSILGLVNIVICPLRVKYRFNCLCSRFLLCFPRQPSFSSHTFHTKVTVSNQHRHDLFWKHIGRVWGCNLTGNCVWMCCLINPINISFCIFLPFYFE